MKPTIVILLLVAACGIAYWWFVPSRTFIIFHRPDGGTVTFSRWRIEFEGPPDRYSAGGFDHIEPYVSRLMAQPPQSRWVGIFTPSGDRGFALRAHDGTVEAHLTVQWRQEPQREAAIRAFFGSRAIRATEDYLAANGGVPDATRLLAYPLIGSSEDIAALTKRILHELCGISSAEPLHIQYTEK